MDITKHLRYLRVYHRYTQQEIADKVGISKSSYNRFEKGSRTPGIKTLETIANVYKIPIQFFFIKDFLNISGKYYTITELGALFEVQSKIALHDVSNINAVSKRDIKVEMKKKLKEKNSEIRILTNRILITIK